MAGLFLRQRAFRQVEALPRHLHIRRRHLGLELRVRLRFPDGLHQRYALTLAHQFAVKGLDSPHQPQRLKDIAQHIVQVYQRVECLLRCDALRGVLFYVRPTVAHRAYIFYIAPEDWVCANEHTESVVVYHLAQ